MLMFKGMKRREYAPNTLSRLRLGSLIARLLGSGALRSDVQAPVPQVRVGVDVGADIQAYWRQIGGQGDYRVDPFDVPPPAPAKPAARPLQPAPYQVASERGPRFETREEMGNRMAAFRLRFPTANAHEASYFEYSGQLPPGSNLQPSGVYARHMPTDLSPFSGYKTGASAPKPAIGASAPPEHMTAEHITALPGPLMHGGDPVAVQTNRVPVTPNYVPVNFGGHPQ